MNTFITNKVSALMLDSIITSKTRFKAINFDFDSDINCEVLAKNNIKRTIDDFTQKIRDFTIDIN